ncbi:MAG: hypothetical protein GY750_03235 [Lentisphaerae bacterium]|nr:hypothetical protein [Lentisphaerota bacterium]
MRTYGFSGRTTPAKPPTGWRLSSGVTGRQMKQDAPTALAYCPLLLPVGDTPTGELLVDFEQLGVVSVVGDPAGHDGLLRSLVAVALASPWTGDTEIVAIGVPGVHPAPGSGVVVPDDPQAWAETAAVTARRQATERTRSPYEERIDGLVGDTVNRLVIVGAGHAGVAQHLAGAAELAHSTLTVVSGSELGAEYRLVAGPMGVGWWNRCRCASTWIWLMRPIWVPSTSS